MTIRKFSTLFGVAVTAAALIAGCKQTEGDEDQVIAGLEDDEEAFQSTLDASEAAIAGSSAFAPGGHSSFAGCTGSVTGTNFIDVCARQVPGNRTVTWSCTGNNGNGISGTATIVTTVVNATACPNVTVRHDVTFARTATLGNIHADLAGTSQVTFTLDVANLTAQRAVEVDLTRKVYRGETLIRDQGLQGSRVADFAANAPGPADDTRTVNGNTAIQFNLANSSLDLGATDLLWVRGCCHPVGGTLDWQFSGEQTGSGTITFGPACGEAYRADSTAVDLRTCPIW